MRQAVSLPPVGAVRRGISRPVVLVSAALVVGLLVLSAGIVFWIFNANPSIPPRTDGSTVLPSSPAVKTPSPSPARPTVTPSTSKIPTVADHIYDQAHVLNSGLIQAEAVKLSYPLDVYSTATFIGTTSEFIQLAKSHVTRPRLIVIDIDTLHNYVYIQSGTQVPLSNSQATAAAHAFWNGYGKNDYTGATISAIRSLEKSLG